MQIMGWLPAGSPSHTLLVRMEVARLASGMIRGARLIVGPWPVTARDAIPAQGQIPTSG